MSADKVQTTVPGEPRTALSMAGEEINRLREPNMAVSDVLWECLRHFAHMDEANAAMHTAQVRYSPITFRLAEALVRSFEPLDNGPKDEAVRRVFAHKGLYPEDTGRQGGDERSDDERN